MAELKNKVIMSVSVETDVMERLNDLALQTGISRSNLVRIMINDYFYEIDNKEKNSEKI